MLLLRPARPFAPYVRAPLAATVKLASGRSASALAGDAIGELQQHPPRFWRENTIESFDKSSMHRVVNHLPPEISITTARREKDGRVHLEFSDGHVGHVKLNCRPLPELGERRLWGARNIRDIERELRGGSLSFSYDKLMDRSDHASRWIEAMHVTGVSLVTDVPSERYAISTLVGRVAGSVVSTYYGKQFTIKAVAKPNNLAYSADGLQAHTDLPYYRTPPGIQLFHCLNPAEEGGASIVVDGFDVARSLQETNPAAFAILTKRRVRFSDRTTGWHLSALQHTITCNDKGEVDRVCFNERTRDSWMDRGTSSPEFYHALSAFERLIDDKARHLSYTARAGDMIITDNWRTLHSRTSFVGSRLFEGGYMDWDEARAFWLLHQLGKEQRTAFPV